MSDGPPYSGFSIGGTQPDNPTSDSQSSIIVEVSRFDLILDSTTFAKPIFVIVLDCF